MKVIISEDQLALFNTPVIRVKAKYRTIAQQFAHFHELNPHVYKLLVALAREYLEATGNERIGIAALFEELRWRARVHVRTNSDYALNNNYRSMYARLIAKQEPDLADAFELRQLRSAA